MTSTMPLSTSARRLHRREWRDGDDDIPANLGDGVLHLPRLPEPGDG